MVNEVACFLTCGYTEAGAMQSFLRKMNGENDYRQYLPNKTIKKKGMPKKIKDDVNGLTGEKLLEKIYDILSKQRAEIRRCKAILIEDDLDGKFHEWPHEKIEEYTQGIICTVRAIIGMNTMPVWLLYASPEIESWFLADWEHGFKNLFFEGPCLTGVDTKVRAYYCFHLKQYLERHVLLEYASDIENYGWFNGSYVKLSTKIIEAIEIGAIVYMEKIHNANTEYVRQLTQSCDIRYSKKLHGDIMLRNIEPDLVAEKCFRYFRASLLEIQKVP